MCAGKILTPPPVYSLHVPLTLPLMLWVLQFFPSLFLLSFYLSPAPFFLGMFLTAED